MRIGPTTQLLLRLSTDREVSFIGVSVGTLHLPEGGVIMVLLCLGWDVLYALKLLACLLQEFGGFINFTGSDLAEGQLSNGLCKAIDSSIFDGSLPSQRLSCLQVVGWRLASGHSVNTHRVATFVKERHGEVWQKSLAGRKLVERRLNGDGHHG